MRNDPFVKYLIVIPSAVYLVIIAALYSWFGEIALVFCYPIFFAVLGLCFLIFRKRID